MEIRNTNENTNTPKNLMEIRHAKNTNANTNFKIGWKSKIQIVKLDGDGNQKLKRHKYK